SGGFRSRAQCTVGTVPNLLAPVVRLLTQARTWTGGCAGFGSGLFRPRDQDSHIRARRPREGAVSFFSSWRLETFHRGRPRSGTGVETRRRNDPGAVGRQCNRRGATLRSDVARLRKRYRLILREEVRGTVMEAAEVDDELRHLCRTLVAT